MSFVTLYSTCFTFTFFTMFFFVYLCGCSAPWQTASMSNNNTCVLRATFVKALRVHSSMGFKLSSQQQQSSQMQQNLPQNNIQFFWFVYLPGN